MFVTSCLIVKWSLFTCDLDLDRQLVDLIHRNSLPAQSGSSIKIATALKKFSCNGSNEKKISFFWPINCFSCFNTSPDLFIIPVKPVLLTKELNNVALQIKNCWKFHLKTEISKIGGSLSSFCSLNLSFFLVFEKMVFPYLTGKVSDRPFSSSSPSLKQRLIDCNRIVGARRRAIVGREIEKEPQKREKTSLSKSGERQDRASFLAGVKLLL